MSGERLISPSGFGRSPAAKQVSFHCDLKNEVSGSYILNIFSHLPTPLPRSLLLPGCGERLSSPSGFGRSLAAKRFSVHFYLKNEVSGSDVLNICSHLPLSLPPSLLLPGYWERLSSPSGFGRSPAAKQVSFHCDLKNEVSGSYILNIFSKLPPSLPLPFCCLGLGSAIGRLSSKKPNTFTISIEMELGVRE